MKLTFESPIPELDEPINRPLIDVIAELQDRDEGFCVRLRTGSFARGGELEYHAPTVMGAYHDRIKQPDGELWRNPVFADTKIVEAIREIGAGVDELLTKTLKRGVFCLDLHRGIVGYNPDFQNFEGRDAYRMTSNPNGIYSTGSTSIGIVEEAISYGFELRLFRMGHKVLHFAEKIPKESILKATC